MQGYKLAFIASQSQQKATLEDPKSAHCHTEPLTSLLVPTPPPCHLETHNDTLQNGHFQETSWRRSSAPPGAPGAGEVIARGSGWAGWPPDLTPGCSSHQYRSPTGDSKSGSDP